MLGVGREDLKGGREGCDGVTVGERGRAGEGHRDAASSQC